MDKKTYNSNSDEEYQFQEPASETHFAATPTEPSSTIFERINRQHIIFGFIFIFLIFGAYKLINRFFHAALKPQAIEKVQKIAVKQPLIDDNVNAKITARLDRLLKGESDVQSAIQSLDSQISDIQTSLANLNSQLGEVNDRIQSLRTGQETLIQKQTKVVKKIDKKEAPKAVYYVRAIIPGRVWLTTQEGITLTLGVGDNLKGYGTIDAINPDQGTITLSSGAIIGYSPNDR